MIFVFRFLATCVVVVARIMSSFCVCISVTDLRRSEVSVRLLWSVVRSLSWLCVSFKSGFVVVFK